MESACLFSVYKSNKYTGICSVQLEIAEMLCKSFFESQYRTILHTFSSGRLLLANQAVGMLYTLAERVVASHIIGVIGLIQLAEGFIGISRNN